MAPLNEEDWRVMLRGGPRGASDPERRGSLLWTVLAGGLLGIDLRKALAGFGN
jgi:hypothetical protein